MSEFALEASRFRQQKDEFERQARQTAAFFLISGIDLAAALAATGIERRRIAARIARLMERERLKGMRRHWSYDLNRHIALKQALDRLAAQDPRSEEAGSPQETTRQKQTRPQHWLRAG
ncbi:cytoplasmic protein [Mesorhizobium sp. J428]|uniref:cytoplasmic protein n=1 Tax=Mesorhizobium sp. J428 TaxID=2898440 RepID=UPI002151EE25|nr:cytoplasmic protein [Mesorhizobium sp. J428]MCR5858885.1 cytoplasmic protein [Mesorhizobium sp. J428]